MTKQGDKVVAINAEKSLMVVRLEREGLLGTEYNGYLAIVKDPSRVSLGLCRGMGEREGQRIPDLADYNSAILGINASGFIDNGEDAEGGTPYGYVKHDGEVLQGEFGHGYKIIGFDASTVSSSATQQPQSRWWTRSSSSGAHRQRPED